MIGQFLQTAILGNNASVASFSPIIIILYILFWVFAYIFTSIAYTSIGKKAGLTAPALAWIPGLGPMITAFRASKMHWWPWLLSIGLVTLFIAGISALAKIGRAHV